MRDYTFKALLPVSAPANVTTRKACCGAGSPEQSEGYAGANIANVKPQRGGRSQNGLLLFVIG